MDSQRRGSDMAARNAQIMDIPKKQIILNRIQTPDGTILTSYHRHDYVGHDDKNGKYYAVDGGTAYLRRVGSMEFKDLSEYYEYDNHGHNRKYMAWGTYGKEGMQPLKWVLVKDLDTEHIQKLLGKRILSVIMRDCLKKELDMRKAA